MKTIFKYKMTSISVVLILIAVLMPSSDVPSVGIPHIDKLVHCGMFGFLTLCYYGEYYKEKKMLPPFLVPWLLLELFGLATEVMQNFAVGRSCDVLDLAADSVGIILAIITYRFWIYWKNNK